MLDTKNINKMIFKFRNDRKMSIMDICDKYDISYATWWNSENTEKISYKVLFKIALEDENIYRLLRGE